MSTSDVKPTRMELIETKRKIKLSKSGYKLLKMKRDGLIMEFFELLPKVKDLRSQLSALYSDAMEKLAIPALEIMFQLKLCVDGLLEIFNQTSLLKNKKKLMAI